MVKPGDCKSPATGITSSNLVRPTIYWGLSSVGRALALQARGHEFDPRSLHQFD